MSATSKLALTLSTGFVKAFLAETEVPESEVPLFLSKAGIPMTSLAQSRARITEEQFAALYQHIALRFDDEMPNLLSQPVRGGAMKFAGLGIIGAGTLGTAIYRHTQFLRIMVHDFELQLNRHIPVSTVTIKEPEDGRRCKPLALIMALKVIHGFASWLVGRELPLLNIHFAFNQPTYGDEIKNMFPGPVSFDQSCSQLTIESGLLDLRVQRKVGDLKSFLSRQPLDWICISHTERLVTHQVRDYFLRHDLSKVSIDQVAKALNVSNRTLCRKLEAENTSFRQAKDDVRRDLAIERLTHSTAPIAQIAYELGFGDASSFHRAFRTWTGMTPSTYRDEGGS
jgi:AraC-like DNA-binding protein